MKKLFGISLFILITSLLFGQSWQDTVSKIEKICGRYKPGNPGAQLAISRNGKVIYSGAWGLADMEHHVALTTQSILEAGSVSKQFTAAAILLLEQDGKLSLGDDVRKFIPELPDYGYTITLRQMMQHTSGLKDWGSVMVISGWPRSTKTYSNEDALYVICNQKTLNNRPGDEFIYSNSNYNLFAIIVQRVSGQSLAEFTRKRIFEPAGMKNTQWRDNYKRIVPNRAMAYSKTGGSYLTNMPNEYVYGNGGLLTTAEDLLTWNNYYLDGKLGNPSLLSRQLTADPLNNGVMRNYAAGLFVDSARGWRYIWHDGATASYRAKLEHFPDLGLSFAWLSNTSEFDNDTLDVTDAVRNLFVKDKQMSPKKETAASFIVSKEKLNSYAGWYRNNRTGGGVRLFVQNDKLYATQVGALTSLSENVFLAGNNRIEFNPKGFVFINAAKDSVYFNAVDSARLNEKIMSQYAGEYYSDETESKLFVTIDNGKLLVVQKPITKFQLTPTYKDAFEFPPGILYFERDKKGKITTMKISISRARNIGFKKIN